MDEREMPVELANGPVAIGNRVGRRMVRERCSIAALHSQKRSNHHHDRREKKRKRKWNICAEHKIIEAVLCFPAHDGTEARSLVRYRGVWGAHRRLRCVHPRTRDRLSVFMMIRFDWFYRATFGGGGGNGTDPVGMMNGDDPRCQALGRRVNKGGVDCVTSNVPPLLMASVCAMCCVQDLSDTLYVCVCRSWSGIGPFEEGCCCKNKTAAGSHPYQLLVGKMDKICSLMRTQGF